MSQINEKIMLEAEAQATERLADKYNTAIQLEELQGKLEEQLSALKQSRSISEDADKIRFSIPDQQRDWDLSSIYLSTCVIILSIEEQITTIQKAIDSYDALLEQATKSIYAELMQAQSIAA